MPNIRVGLKTFLLLVRREYRFVFATFAASGIGYLGSAAAPVIVNALIDAGLNHQQTGNLGTVELSMLALASTLITPYVPIFSHRKLAVSGTVITILGVLISACSVSYAAMIVGRIVTGLGSGIAISGANAAVAAREDAERIFAIIWTMGGAITASLALGLPDVVVGGNYQMGFSVLLLLCFVGLPVIFWMPHRPVAADAGAVTKGERVATGTATVSGAELAKPFGLLSVMALAGIFLYAAGEQALWNFAYNIPIEAGVDPTLASQVLAFTTIMGLAGGGIAALLGVRLGRVVPIALGTCLSVAGRWFYINSSSGTTLLIGSLLWGIGFYFVSPFQIGLVAAIDRKGRVAVAAGAAINFGYAAGPGVAGWILQFMDRDSLVVAIVASTFGSLLLLLPLAIRVDREVRGARSFAEGSADPN
jgi:MFS family permease